jgi:hypothetical protein
MNQDAELMVSSDRSPAAARVRLHRERRRQGLRCLMIELRETEIDVLVGRGLLNSETRHDPRAVTEASPLPRTSTMRKRCRPGRGPSHNGDAQSATAHLV